MEPRFTLEDLNEDDLRQLKAGIVSADVQAMAARLIDYTLPELIANAAKPVQKMRRRSA